MTTEQPDSVTGRIREKIPSTVRLNLTEWVVTATIIGVLGYLFTAIVDYAGAKVINYPGLGWVTIATIGVISSFTISKRYFTSPLKQTVISIGLWSIVWYLIWELFSTETLKHHRVWEHSKSFYVTPFPWDIINPSAWFIPCVLAIGVLVWLSHKSDGGVTP